MESGYIILDIETTGLSKDRHKITEIAALKVKGNVVIDKFETLVNPEVPIPRFITRLTGIDDELVKDAPTVCGVLPQFLDFVEDLPIVAHNASFDWGFINANCNMHLGKGLDNDRLCTRKLANRLLPNLGSKKLSNLCNHFNLVNDQAHRAMSDVKVTYQVFNEFLGMMKEKGIQSKEDVQNFEKSKISRY